MPLYTFLHNLLNVLVQIANKMGLQKEKYNAYRKMAERGTVNVITTTALGLNLEKILQEQSTDEMLVIVVKCCVSPLPTGSVCNVGCYFPSGCTLLRCRHEKDLKRNSVV
jgi:hypothetical protein